MKLKYKKTLACVCHGDYEFEPLLDFPFALLLVFSISAMLDKRCNWPHGRGLGGSSIINYMIYTRGNRRDFDRIAAAGNPGWGFDSILPFYQKFEKSIVESIDDTDSFGKNGQLQIEEARFRQVY